MEIPSLNIIIPDGPYGAPYSSINAAIGGAATRPGAVIWIPPGYNPAETYVNPNNVPIFDMRGSGSVSFASTGSTLTISTKNVNFSAQVLNAYFVTTGSSTIITTLPTAVGNSGDVIFFKKVDSGVGLVSVATTSAQTIDGLSTYSLVDQWQFLEVVSDGSNWQIISNN